MINHYDVIIIGAGPGGLYAAYELSIKNPDISIAIFESGNSIENRSCPICDGKVDHCINCAYCSIMTGFGGAGAFSDGKYNITNDFGGNLCNYIGNDKAIIYMNYVDDINNKFMNNKLSARYECKDSKLHSKCLMNDLHLLSAQIRHLGTDNNLTILRYLYDYFNTEDNISIFFNTSVTSISTSPFDGEDEYFVHTLTQSYRTNNCIIAVGRSGSKWVEKQCSDLGIKTHSNKVDIGVRVELPHETFKELTDAAYEAKIVYHTKQYEDAVRTFCMNPHGIVVSENTNGIITVNGHSYEAESMHTDNTNFALLVSKSFTEPFENSNEYGESIAKLSNMLGGGVIVQRFGDLIRGRRSTKERIKKSFVKPTLTATPGDLSLVIPKRILDDIIEMIYQLDKVAPGTANDDTLLYGVEVKFYNVNVAVDKNLETKYKGLYIIGDCSGVTHSLSQASASGVYVADNILRNFSK